MFPILKLLQLGQLLGSELLTHFEYIHMFWWLSINFVIRQFLILEMLEEWATSVSI